MSGLFRDARPRKASYAALLVFVSAYLAALLLVLAPGVVGGVP